MIFGEKITVQVNVIGINDELLSGTIEFFRNDMSVGKETLKNNRASIVLDKLESGTYEINAAFIPDETCINYWESGSESIKLIVVQQGDIIVDNQHTSDRPQANKPQADEQEESGGLGVTISVTGILMVSIGGYVLVKKRKKIGEKK